MITKSVLRWWSTYSSTFLLVSGFANTCKYRGLILVQNPDESLQSFPLCYSQSPSAALPWDFYIYKLTQPLKVSRAQLLYTVKEKRGKPYRKPYPLPYCLRNPYRNLKSENSQDHAQKPQRNCMFMNSASAFNQKSCYFWHVATE